MSAHGLKPLAESSMKEFMSENEQIDGNSKPTADKQKNGKGVADRPHLWTVFLALGALVVSIGSFVMSYLASVVSQRFACCLP
jgi:hypothetical protein